MSTTATTNNNNSQAPAAAAPSPKEKEREALMLAAAELIVANGLDSVTIEQVAKQAKLDLKKVKGHFPSPEAILDELIRRELHDSEELFNKAVNDRGKADIKITRLVRELLTRYQGGFSLYHVVNHRLEHAPEEDKLLESPLSREHIDKYRHNTAILGRLIAQGQSEGLFTDVDPLEAAYLLRGMIKSALMYRRIAKKEGDMRDTADTIMRVFLKGLLR